MHTQNQASYVDALGSFMRTSKLTASLDENSSEPSLERGDTDNFELLYVSLS